MENVVGRRALLAGGLAMLGCAAAAGLPRKGFDAFVRAWMARAAIPGMAVGYAKDGIVRFARPYGLADIAARRPVMPDTMFHLASVTKTVTAAMAMRLAEQGRFDLDAPVAPHLDFALANPHCPDLPITFRHLLMHTSGISDAKYYAVDFRSAGKDAAQTLGDFLQDYLTPGGTAYDADGCFSASAPGANWDYSNVGFALLGYLVERVGGEDLCTASQRAIFAPLGMTKVNWTLSGIPQRLRETPYDVVDGKPVAVAPDGFPDYPAGMLSASMPDFMRFVAACANGGVAGNARLLKSETMAQMLYMRRPAGLPEWLTGQGLGWQSSKLDGADRPNHWGGDRGVFTAVYLDPARRSGTAIFTNVTATPESKTAVKAIAARVLGAA